MRPETKIMKETPWSRIRGQTKQRGQKILGDCLQWKANGQCSKGDNCSFRHDVNKRAKMTPIRLRILSCDRRREMRREPEVPEERVPVVECLDGLARITSKELAQSAVAMLKKNDLHESIRQKSRQTGETRCQA